MPRSDTSEFGAVFQRLRGVLEKHAGSLDVSDDTSTKYCLEAMTGPATLKAWGGKARRPMIPVAWVEVGKSYVSYHLMGMTTPSVQAGMSPALKARMQGKTCFNFTASDPALFTEIAALTSTSIAVLRKSGFIV